MDGPYAELHDFGYEGEEGTVRGPGGGEKRKEPWGRLEFLTTWKQVEDFLMMGDGARGGWREEEAWGFAGEGSSGDALINRLGVSFWRRLC